MQLKDMTVADLAALTASNSPAPGGGAIAALTGAYGVALASMVASLTIGKKGYEDVQDEMKSLLQTGEQLREELLEAIQKDSTSFDAFMAAMGLPKDTDEEKAARKEAMQKALKEAAEVPYQTAVTAAKIMPLAEQAVRYGNANAVTDGLVSAMLASAAVRGALLNVKINLSSIKDEAYVADLKQKCFELEESAIKAEAHILSLVPELA